MKTPLKVLGGAGLLLVVLFLAPIVYGAGQRWNIYLNCPADYRSTEEGRDHCWRSAGVAVMNGGRIPRR